MPALTTPLAAWTAVMAPFALAFRALKLGLRSAETPDFFEFRLGGFGGGAICRLWRCSVWRHPRGLPRGFAPAETSAAAGPSSTAAIAGASALALLLLRGFGRERGLDVGLFRSLRLGRDL